MDAAEAAYREVWKLLPEPKFNTSCSYIALSGLIETLIKNKKFEEAKALLEAWMQDFENCGYPITQFRAYMFLGEIYLYQNEIDLAKEQSGKAVRNGAIKRYFNDQPPLYFDIAKGRITDNEEIKERFAQEVLNKS